MSSQAHKYQDQSGLKGDRYAYKKKKNSNEGQVSAFAVFVRMLQKKRKEQIDTFLLTIGE